MGAARRRWFRIVHRKRLPDRWREPQDQISIQLHILVLRVRGNWDVVSNERFYLRRAAEERTRAARALTEEARELHQRLARHFAARAQERELQASG